MACAGGPSGRQLFASAQAPICQGQRPKYVRSWVARLLGLLAAQSLRSCQAKLPCGFGRPSPRCQPWPVLCRAFARSGGEAAGWMPRQGTSAVAPWCAPSRLRSGREASFRWVAWRRGLVLGWMPRHQLRQGLPQRAKAASQYGALKQLRPCSRCLVGEYNGAFTGLI